MTTIICTADLHIKLGQKNVPRDWAKNRYRMFLEQLQAAESDADILVIPGDVFDRVPTMEELDIYFELVHQRKKQTIISTGNHEAQKKGKSFFAELKQVTERLNPLVEVCLEVKDYGDFTVVPYEFISKKTTWDSLESKPVFTHVRGEIPPHVKPEIPLEWLDKFPIVFAGDLHSHSNTQRNVIYPGSPMTTSFHRSEVETGYLKIQDIKNPTVWDWLPFNLPQLLRKTVSDPSDMLPTDYHHTIYELEGNAVDLANVSGELLDKKLVKRSNEVALILHDKTVREEALEYLKYIMLLEDETIDEVMGEYDELYPLS